MAKTSLDAKVRPLANVSLEKASLVGAARLYISRDSFISLTGGLETGRACSVEKLDDSAHSMQSREASLWVLPDKNVSANVVMMTRAFQDATGFKIGDQVRIMLGDSTPDAEEVVVEETGEKTGQEVAARHPPCWEPVIAQSLDRAGQVYPGMKLEGVAMGMIRKSFQVVSVNSLTYNLARFVMATTYIHIQGPDGAPATATTQPQRGELVFEGIPGLTAQTTTINDFLEPFTRPFRVKGECESCGFVIHGGHGTGKTFTLQMIEKTRWGKTYWIKPSDKLSTIREVFKQASSQRPSLIFLDELEKLITKDRANRESVIEALAEELDALSAQALANNALPEVVVIATCADYMFDVPKELQKLSRFQRNIALPIPRASERLKILKHMDPPIDPSARESMLADIASKTHAYNMADLRLLFANAKFVLAKRLGQNSGATTGPLHQEALLSTEDIQQALRMTRPTAMHDINLKPPTIHWEDIGGQESLKRVLSGMIHMSRDTGSHIRRVLRHLPKGLLLYGPPGCSKTLSAQAMATESSFNFFAVKGAELLNMYVGESERAIRNLFERARAASPSIIFFDEIDSIGGQRAGPGGAAASRSTGSVNMLTTLLTEMDGFETLTGVLILAATNRPEAMDPALIRPGRFDEFVYVGPPDQAAREAVFRVHLRGLSLAEDVEISEIARQADGHSGAEIQSICQSAGKTVYEKWRDLGAKESEADEMQIKMADLEAALRKTRRAITSEMIWGYEAWRNQFTK